MSTEQFLRRVLPEDGTYCLAVLDASGKMYHYYYASVFELSKNIVRLDSEGKNIYYCISALDEKRRIKSNVRTTKVFVLDVDCGEGKPFNTWKDAAVATGKYITAVGLPKPIFVFSGRGLHIYWVLDKEVSLKEWLPIAKALKHSTKVNNFEVDSGPTANSVLLLRPVGAKSHKTGKSARILLDAEPTTLEVMRSALSKYVSLGELTTPTVPTATTKRLNSPLLENLSTTNYLPANPELVSSKCKQINWITNKQKDVPEPLWYLTLGVAAYCKDAKETAIEWSSNHPDYSESGTLKKLAQWQKSTTGPATCRSFSDVRPTGCSKCPYKGKIASPAQIGTQHQTIDITPDAPDCISKLITLPRPFKRTSTGIKITIDSTDIDICDFDIYPVSYGLDESLGYEVVRYHWNRIHVGWIDLVFRQAYLVCGSKEFATAIADQGIVLSDQPKTILFQTMLRSYIAELKQARSLTNLYQTMGWKQNSTGFVIGDTFITKDKDGNIIEEIAKLSSNTPRKTSNHYKSKGDLQAWVNLTSILDRCSLSAHKFMLGVGFSAPLYHFTGLKGITISLYGPTGGGKSLAQYWMQSIYGNPDDLHFSAKYTQNSLFSRIGLYSHLPMSVDEVTMMKDSDVSDFCYWVTQGKDKIRLDRNSQEQEAKTWATPVVVSTNIALQAKLIAAKLDTDAQMARLLELSVPAKGLFVDSSELGRKIHYAIHNCYGHTGREFIKKLLLLGEEQIKDIIADANNRFAGEFGVRFSGQERFWEQAIILSNLANELAFKWGLINYDYKEGTRWVIGQLGTARRTISENKADSFDLLAEYMSEFANTILTVESTDGGALTFNPYRLPRADVRMRVHLMRKAQGEHFDRGTIMIDRRHFRQWLSGRGGDYKTFRAAASIRGTDATPKSEKCSMGKGTPIKLAQVYVIGINLNHPRLIGLLETTSSIDDNTYGSLLDVESIHSA